MLYALTHLTKTYDERTILDIGSLEIEEEGIYALLGPNGAGKTTLLQMLAFLEPPTTGSIVYDAKPVVFTESHLRPLRRSVVLVDQQPMLFTTTVYKNIEFGLRIRRVSKADRPRIVEEALDLVGMLNFARSPASKLSGGETQRVALARAIAVSPEVLLCDEPTSSVDAENQITILNILRQINNEKKITVLFTTHDSFQAASLANHILYLDHGRLTEAPSENIFPAVWTRTGDHRGVLDIQGAIRLNIPSEMMGGEKEKIRLMIHPGKLDLGAPDRDHDKADSGNQPVTGRVVQITEEKDKIRIVVDVGTRLTLLVPRDKYVRDRTLVGEQVSVLIPPEAVEILPAG